MEQVQPWLQIASIASCMEANVLQAASSMPDRPLPNAVHHACCPAAQSGMHIGRVYVMPSQSSTDITVSLHLACCRRQHLAVHRGSQPCLPQRQEC